MAGWRAITRGSETTVIVHVLPVKDARSHDEVADRCWCRPTVDRHDGPGPWLAIIVIHHAADGRQLLTPPAAGVNVGVEARI